MTRPTLQDIYKARALLANYMSPTPLHHYPGLDALLGSETYVKHENHTRLGAFKIRGALNTMSQLSPEQKERGIVVASSGNFGQGMAYAGRIFGAKAIVVLPENPNPSKVAAIKAFGAEVVLSDTVYDADPCRHPLSRLRTRLSSTSATPQTPVSWLAAELSCLKSWTSSPMSTW